jgi:hypothetical protein
MSTCSQALVHRLVARAGQRDLDFNFVWYAVFVFAAMPLSIVAGGRLVHNPPSGRFTTNDVRNRAAR